MQFTIRLCRADGTVACEAVGSHEAALSVDAFQSGDYLEFHAEGTAYAVIHLHDSVKDALLYIPDGKFTFAIPEGQALSGFAPGTFEGAQHITMRAAEEDEIKGYRNLCLNPLDFRFPSEVVDPDAPEWSNPTDSAAIQNGEVLAYPHVYANRVTRNEGCFYARNAIDGMTVTDGHGNYPYHSWGGAVHEDLTYAVYFGRPVSIDKLVLYLRSDYRLDDQGREHDTYWHTAFIELSDGFTTEIHPKKRTDGQTFSLGQHTTSWFKLSRLDPLQHDKSQNFAALTQIEVWGSDIEK